MADTIIQIVMRAKDEATKVMQQVAGQMQRTQQQTTSTSRSLQGALTIGSSIARAGLASLAIEAGYVASQMVQLRNDLEEAAGGIAAVAGSTAASIPEIKKQLGDLVAANDNTAKEVGDALKTVYTAFAIFDPKDPKGLAQILLDWKDVTGKNFSDAGAEFKRITLTYFGPDADINEELPKIADKLLAVAKAVGIDPGGLAKALADGGPTFKAVFGDMDTAIKFLATVGAAGGDVSQAERAVRTFFDAIQKIRDEWKNGGTSDQATLDALKALGLSKETVQNEGTKIGKLITDALKNAMADGKISDDELKAFGVLFGPKFADDMALTAQGAKGASEKIDAALKNYVGSLKKAADEVDQNFGARFQQAWNSFLVNMSDTVFGTGLEDIMSGLQDYIVEVLQGHWDGAVEALAGIGDGLFKVMLGKDPKVVADSLIAWWDDVAATNVKDFPSKILTWIQNNLGSIGAGILASLLHTDSTAVSSSLTLWWDTAIAPELSKFDGSPLKWVKEKLEAIGDNLFKFLLGADPKNVADALVWWWDNDVAPEFTKFKDNPLKWASGKLAQIGNGLFSFLLGTDIAKVTSSLGNWWDSSIMPEMRKFAANPIDWTASKLATITNDLFKTLLGADAATVVTNLKNWWDNTAFPGIKAFPARVIGWVKAGMDFIGNDFFKLLFGATAGEIAASIKDWWDKTIYPKVSSFFSVPIKLIGDVGGALWDGIKAGFNAAVLGALGVTVWLTNKWTDIKAGFDLWLEPLKTWAGGLWVSLKDGFNNVFNGSEGVVQWLANKWTVFRNQFGLWWTGLVEIGGNLLKGLLKGMGDAWKSVEDEINKIGGDVLKTFKAIFGIKSPSLELKTIGDFLMQGLIEGLNGAYPEVMKLIKDVSDEIIAIWNDGKPAWNKFGDFISAKIKDWGKDLTGFGKMATNVFASFASFLGNEAANGFKDFGQHLKDFIGQMIDGLEIQIAVQSATGIAAAVAQAPLTFGVSLLAIPGIIAEAAIGIAALEAGRALVNSFAVGTPYVPNDQMAQIHRGEMILPASFAEGVRRGDVQLGGGNSSQPIVVQLYLDGRMISEQVANRFQDGIRQLVRADLRTTNG